MKSLQGQATEPSTLADSPARKITRQVEPAAAKAVPLERLQPAPWNPRTIKDERFQNLVKSIQADPDFLWRRRSSRPRTEPSTPATCVTRP